MPLAMERPQGAGAAGRSRLSGSCACPWRCRLLRKRTQPMASFDVHALRVACLDHPSPTRCRSSGQPAPWIWTRSVVSASSRRLRLHDGVQRGQAVRRSQAMYADAPQMQARNRALSRIGAAGACVGQVDFLRIEALDRQVLSHWFAAGCRRPVHAPARTREAVPAPVALPSGSRGRGAQ
jgi:hypothetical protein